MVIKPNAAPEELSSPFFKGNEKFCSGFETYITKKNGKVKGNYNAWSYLIYGKISDPKKWTLMYEKATLSSGNLWLSSKRQNLVVMAEWSTNSSGTHDPEFYIRKKRRFDFLRIRFFKHVSNLTSTNNYVIVSQTTNTHLISKLTEILSGLFKSKEIHRIERRNGKLTIKLHTEKHHFEVFDKILQM